MTHTLIVAFTLINVAIILVTLPIAFPWVWLVPIRWIKRDFVLERSLPNIYGMLVWGGLIRNARAWFFASVGMVVIGGLTELIYYAGSIGA